MLSATFEWIKKVFIGQGSLGRVYQASNLTNGDTIAVKQVVLPRTERDRKDSRAMSVIDALKSENDILRDLDHPHIVHYLSFEVTDEVLNM